MDSLADRVVPFLVEDSLKKKGGVFSRADDWASYVVIDGHPITGQNPTWPEEAAHAVLKVLKDEWGVAKSSLCRRFRRDVKTPVRMPG